MTDDMLTIETTIAAPVDAVWGAYSSPEAITQWNFAAEDWHCPSATVDLRPGGRLVSRMEARDGSMGFDFGGTYDEVEPNKTLSVVMDDGRRYRTTFEEVGEGTRVVTRFQPEGMHSHEMQQAGWQAILENFRRHVETEADG